MAYKVLIVDDDSYMRTMLQATLKKEGFEIVAVAANGREALARYAEHKPDIVTMDVAMPGIDGLQALKKLKERFPDSRIVICSGTLRRDVILSAVKAGADEFVVKPFQISNLVSTLNKVLGNT